MLILKKQRSGISYNYVWFADRPNPKDALKPVVYMQCRTAEATTGFTRQPFHTMLIDLQQDSDTILGATSRSTSYQIKRAMREGVVFEPVSDLAAFISFYNEFAQTKQQSILTEGDFSGWGKHTVAFATLSDGRPLAMHSYIVDPEISRVRLLHSASHFRTSDDSSERNAVGRANRYLHYATMLHYKDLGFTQYDMGGYAKDSSDPVLKAIVRFKDGFGGEIVREERFVSWPMQLLQLGGAVAHRLRKPKAS